MSKKEKKEKKAKTKSVSGSRTVLLILLANITVIAIGAIFVYLYFSYMLIVAFVFILVLMDYYFYSQRLNRKKIEDEKKEEEFIALITYFKIYLANGINVYQSLQLASSFLSEWMKEKVDELLDQIDNDKTINPYLNFASLFTLHHYEDIMTSIYQLVDQGGDPAYIDKFIYMFEKINEENTLYQQERTRQSLDMVGSIPVVGSALFTVCLTFGIMTVIGDVVDVL